MTCALRATERKSHSHDPFDFGARLLYDAAAATKIKISPGTPKPEIISTASVMMNDAPLWCPFCRAEGRGDLGSDPFDLR